MVPRSTSPGPRQDPWLGGVVSHMPRAADARTDSYLAVLEKALLDGVIDTDEQDALVGVALETGLTRQSVLSIHRQYLADMAKVATLDHVVTETEHAELVHTARLLGLGQPDLDRALDLAWQEAKAGHSTPPMESIAGITLEAGDRVSFTGDMRVDREVWEKRSRVIGLTTGGVTKTAKLLVASDPNSVSQKANKARTYGIPIVSEAAFETLLADFERNSLAPTVGSKDHA